MDIGDPVKLVITVACALAVVKLHILDHSLVRTQESIYSVLTTESGICHSMRALILTGFGKPKSIPHIMVLIEGIIDKHRIDFEKVKQTFNLTRREMEVLNLICEGYTNKNISERLFVSEYTIKDHIKNIMRKMNVNSRSEVIFLCLK